MSKRFAFVGTWGSDIQGGSRDSEPSEGGIKTFQVDGAQLTLMSNASPQINAGILCVSQDGRFLYATDERKDIGGVSGGGGGVCAYQINPQTGALTFLNEVSSAGAFPCYITTDRHGRYAFVSNHGNHEEVITKAVRTERGTYVAQRVFDEGSIAMFPILPDGRLGECCDVKVLEGSSVVPWYQWTPHPHSVKLDPTQQFLLTGDKGADCIYVYRVDYENGKLMEVHCERANPGSGPRHIAFHPELPYVYINSELDSTVHAYRFDFKTGGMKHIMGIKTIPQPYVPPDPDDHFANNETADIRVHRTGRYLYVSNRGHNSIAVFKLDAEGGMEALERVSTRGEIPRAIQFNLTGDMLYAINQRTGNVVQFSVTADTGVPVPTGYQIQLSNPVCMEFADLPFNG